MGESEILSSPGRRAHRRGSGTGTRARARQHHRSGCRCLLPTLRLCLSQLTCGLLYHNLGALCGSVVIFADFPPRRHRQLAAIAESVANPQGTSATQAASAAFRDGFHRTPHVRPNLDAVCYSVAATSASEVASSKVLTLMR